MSGPAAVGYGLATAGGAGTADFLAKTTTERVGALRSLWYLEIFGAPVLVALAVLFDGLRLPPVGALVGLAGLSGLSLLGLFCLYRAFERGRLSLVAPLTSGYPALTALLSVAVFGEGLGLLQAAGLAVTLGGIALLASRGRSSSARTAPAGVIYALGAFAAFGVFYFGLKLFIGPVPPVTGAAVTRLVGVLGTAVAMRYGGRTWWPPRELRARAVAYPVLDSLSLVTFNLGVLLAGSLAILTTVSGLYGAVTLAWAIVALRERPDRWQWAACGAVFLGVVLLALA